MTILIELPGTLSSTTGMRRVITTNNGFPDDGLTGLHLFTEGTGTSVGNSVVGGSAGLVEHPVASNNAYSWMSGGGIQLDGTEIVSFPTIDVTGAWSLVSMGSVTGSVGGTASERITALLAFRDFTTSSIRGCILNVRGGTDWNSGGTVPYYAHRPSNGAGAQATASNLSPSSGLSLLGQYRMRVVTYNGTDTITSTIYDKTGAVVASGTLTVTDAQLSTGTGSVVVTALKPIVGGPNSAYNGGRQVVEAFAAYNRVLGAADISTLLTKAVALGTARGRAW